MGNRGDYKIEQYIRNLECIADHIGTLRFSVLELESYRRDIIILIGELEKIHDCEQIKDIYEHATCLHNEIINLDNKIAQISKEPDKVKEDYNSGN